ncbi:hypothetical protein MOD48_00420 [Bacillus spizizenii]|uniref:Uncharacterized protein n=2 Tax=Bacillus spizizenii TaxID=96241 RepID=A0A9Q4H913_BACSC|nr:hypothetical protein [Bacillus spizizenii]KFI02255.1 membrane protein [Bacillus sp. BSC154]MDU7575226.1 hypothetical protein [Bacillus subtilis]ADM40077.1 hypothetical protein BSUW23_20225 [Bacillus spizizenii str. W23]AJW85496.1 membrane protein [Bacillus spizizenii]EFG93894.1 hypothetical protein BSU6633_02719 [Bacillus spizizenii ATCC 6633 = JCM 2499]
MWEMIKNFFLFSSGVLQATTLLLVILIFMYVRKTKKKNKETSGFMDDKH